jgi:adenylate cyclase class IV
VRGQVRTRREVFIVGRTRVHLDEVERLGSFVELEVVLEDGEPSQAGEADAQALMRALGLAPGALVPDAYIDLLERHRE